MGLDEDIVAIITDILQDRHKAVSLSSLGNIKSNLSKNKKKLLNRVGIKQFILKFPDKFALIDEVVYLVEPAASPVAVPSPDENSGIPDTHTSGASCEPKAPSNFAIESTITEFSKNRSCMVCFEDVTIFAYGICFHPICYRCSTMLRVLCSDRQCPNCRSELTQVWFAESLEAPGKRDTSSFIKEQKYGILFENKHIQNQHKQLLEHKCRHCETKFDDFDDLKKHMQTRHGEYFCEICLRGCKIFTDERKTYSKADLTAHEEAGDNGEGSAHKGHPLCKFCDHRYLDKNELYRHLRMNHITCPVCSNDHPAFYADVESLWTDHVTKEHSYCDEPGCTFNLQCVFRNEMDLQAHRVHKHPNQQSKAMRRQEQKVTAAFTAPQRVTFQHQISQGERVLQDGSLIIHGSILAKHLRSTYGFIKPDGRSSFYDNIFFNQQACEGLDEDTDLRQHFKDGDRVEVHAKRFNSPTSKSNWRALTVRSIQSNGLLTLGGIDSYTTTRPRTYSGTSVESSASLQGTDFPALSCSSQVDNNKPFVSAWNSVDKIKRTYKSKGLVKKTTKAAAIPPPAQCLSPYGEKPDGYGMLDSVYKDFGFIKRPEGGREDNVYFPRLALVTAEDKKVLDLVKELPAGCKLYFILDPDKPKPGASSKFRASKVWKEVVARRLSTSSGLGSSVSAIKRSSAPASTAANNSTATALISCTPSTAVSSTVVSSSDRPPIEGKGRVHPSLNPTFGFIIWEENRPEVDNIYFNKKAYYRNNSKGEIQSLLQELKPGTQVSFVLESQSPSKGSSKYRAKKVWICPSIASNSIETLTPTDDSPTIESSNDATGSDIRSSSSASEPDSGDSTILTFTAPHDGKTAQVKHLDTLASQTHNSATSATGHDEENSTEDETSVPSHVTPTNNVHNDADPSSLVSASSAAFTPRVPTPPPDTYMAVYSNMFDTSQQVNNLAGGGCQNPLYLHQNNSSGEELYQSSDEDFSLSSDENDRDEEEVSSSVRSEQDNESSGYYVRLRNETDDRFREILVHLLGENKTELLIQELQESLARRCMYVSYRSILFVKLSKRCNAKAFLCPSTDSHPNTEINSLRDRPVDFSFCGFEDSGLLGLVARGMMKSVSQDVMLVTGTSHYITLHRNKAGVVDSLAFHYRPY